MVSPIPDHDFVGRMGVKLHFQCPLVVFDFCSVF